MLKNVDAIETHNGGCTPGGNQAAQELARRYNLPGIGGSDAHYEFQVGRCYTEFEDEILTDEELVAALRSGKYHGICVT
jgi:predicted metal-dependent phosphoesterase TrpH